MEHGTGVGQPPNPPQRDRIGSGEKTTRDDKWLKRVRLILSSSSSIKRREAVYELVAEQVSELNEISTIALDRYRHGREKEVVNRDGAIIPLREYDPNDGRLAIAGHDAVGRRLPILMPDKVALTNPEGDRPLQGMSTEELIQRFKELSSASNS